MIIKDYHSLQAMFHDLMPTYKHNSSRTFVVKFPWDPSIVDLMESISARRCESRRESYLIPGELSRAGRMARSAKAGASIRFGNHKSGHGFSGERKDFCLVGGVYKGKTLTLFYRRLDLLGGLFYDLVLVREIEQLVGPIKNIGIMAVQADVFARNGGSNQKLYAILKEHYATHP